MAETKRKALVSVVLNCAIILFEIIATPIVYRENGLAMFVYYTVLSNYFLCISSVLTVIYSIPILKGKAESVPQFVSRLKYMATCVVTVTLLVVIFILTPTTLGEPDCKNTLVANFVFLMTYGSMLYMHTLCPVLAIISYTVFEKPEIYNKKLPLQGLMFTAVYAVILIPLNAAGIVRGPYPFLMVRDQSILASFIWIVLIFSFAYAIAVSINVLSKRR
ncbi:MAG: hypothetical protein K6F82_01145 [Sphaerochaetaceae bacterium]|nr:hypothetical protein [Sphaerochaetaceae bacterium]